MRTCVFACVLFGATVMGTVPAAAQNSDAQALQQEINQLRQDFDTRLAALEARLASLQGGQPAAPAPPAGAAQAPTGQAPQAPTAEVPAGAAGAGGPTGALPVYGATSLASKIFNPDIAVIGNFLGAAGRNTVNPSPALELPESELSLQAVVDPLVAGEPKLGKVDAKNFISDRFLKKLEDEGFVQKLMGR